MWEITES